MSSPSVLFSDKLISLTKIRLSFTLKNVIFKEDLLKNHHKLKTYLVHYIVFLSLLDRSALARRSSKFLSDPLRFIISVIVCRLLEFPSARRTMHRKQSVGLRFGPALKGQAVKNTLYVKVQPHRTRSAAADCGLCPLRQTASCVAGPLVFAIATLQSNILTLFIYLL